MGLTRLPYYQRVKRILIISVLSIIVVGCTLSDPEQAMRLYQESKSVGGAEKIQLLTDAVRLDDTNPEILQGLADAALDQGDYQLAERTYSTLQQLPDGQIIGLLGRVRTALVQGDEMTATVIVSNEGSLDPQTLVAIGGAYYEESYFIQAADYYEQAITGDPELVSAWTNMGVVQADLGELELARQFMQQAVELDPDNSLTQLNLATILGDIAYTNREQGLETALYVSQALEILDELLDDDPDYQEARLYKGLILFENLQYEDSIPRLTQLYDEAFELQLVTVTLARAYSALGQYDDAERVLLQTLQTDPDNFQIQQEILQLEDIRNE